MSYTQTLLKVSQNRQQWSICSPFSSQAPLRSEEPLLCKTCQNYPSSEWPRWMRSHNLMSKESIVNCSAPWFRGSSWVQVFTPILHQFSSIATDGVRLAWRRLLTKGWDQPSFWCKADGWKTEAVFSSGPFLIASFAEVKLKPCCAMDSDFLSPPISSLAKHSFTKRIKSQQFPTETGMMYSNIQQDTPHLSSDSAV